MKKNAKQFVAALALLLSFVQAEAQTIINTSTVSGIWTLAGSPYIVQVATVVDPGQTLVIAPGVVVQFLPDKSLSVNGQLIAAGTLALPITFEANDTTSWSNPGSGLGGWGGLNINAYYDTLPDNTVMDHCIIRDVKSTTSYASVGLTCSRKLRISNCSFQHNSTLAYCISLNPQSAADTIEIDSCSVTNNFAGASGVIYTHNIWGGYTKIVNSELSSNHNTSVITGNRNNLLIENNLIHHNDQMASMDGVIALHDGTATIRGNKIYFNQCGSLTGIGCINCISVIENNLVCNNTNYFGDCGLTGGGGGLYIAGDFVHTSLGGMYIVRNNIIANNYYQSNCGGGLFVFFAQAMISNNHFINNKVGAPYTGPAVSVWGSASGIESKVYFKNNLFFSESPAGVVDSTKIIFIAAASELLADNNYLPSPFYKSVYATSSYLLLGDTLSNIFGTSPGMVMPTTDNSFSNDATIADFSLQSSSPCIDNGDTTGCYALPYDYAGQNRISNNLIDIGAYEFQQASGIANVDHSASVISVFPNPASGKLTVYYGSQNSLGQLTISDLEGKPVYRVPLNREGKNEVDTDCLAAGIYLVNVLSEQGSVSRKIVIVK